MASPNDAVYDAETRHAIYLERYGGGVARRMVKLLMGASKDIQDRLKDLPDGPTRKLQEVLLKTIRARVETLRNDFRNDLTAELLAAADYEAEFIRDMYQDAYEGLDASFQKVPLANVRAAVMARPFQGIHLRWAKPAEHADELVKRNFKAAQGVIEQGFIQGRSISAINAELRPLLQVKAARDVETISITAIKSMSSAARQEFHAVNPGLIEKERWNSVLDGRTSSYCRSHDGIAYEVGKGPQPPAHPRCRSTRVGIDDDYPPPTKRTYDEWLRSQPADVQDEILGKAKADLFRDGMKLDRFYSDKLNREYTIDELRAMDGRGRKPKPLTKSEKAAVYGYTGDDYRAINRGLRKGDLTGIDEQVALIDSAISKSVQNEKISLYRGIGDSAITEIFPGGVMEIGSVFFDPGYFSASKKRQVAKDFAGGNGFIFEVLLPSGHNALNLEDISKYPNELELLLERSKRFKIVSYDRETKTIKIEPA